MSVINSIRYSLATLTVSGRRYLRPLLLFAVDLKFLLRVVRDVDKAENSLADIIYFYHSSIIYNYAEELGTDILLNQRPKKWSSGSQAVLG